MPDEPKDCIISNGILPVPKYLIGEPVYSKRQWGELDEAGRFTATDAKRVLKKAEQIYNSPKILPAPTGN